MWKAAALGNPCVLNKLEDSFQRYSANLTITVNYLIGVELPTFSCFSFCHCFHIPQGSLKDAAWKLEHTLMVVLGSGLHAEVVIGSWPRAVNFKYSPSTCWEAGMAFYKPSE